jgi:nucleoside recognition membrane protein YjiH
LASRDDVEKIVDETVSKYGTVDILINNAGLQDHFIPVYFSSLLITLIVSAIIARIPPFSLKKSVYLDGRVQTQKDIDDLKSSNDKLFKTALDRAVKKGFTAPPLLGELKSSLKDGLEVLPKVITLLAGIGTAALIMAENTPIFDWLGSLFVPLLNLLRVPNAVEIAPSFPVGIAEMFLPVLLIADKVAILDIGARYMVTAVSIVQIIFFAETIVVMMASKLPMKLWELVLVFLERTFFAIIVASVFMRVLF